MTFEGSLQGSPFEMTTSVPWTLAISRESFSMNFEFHPNRWQNQRLVALPYFESVYGYLRALLGGKEVVLRLYVQGNLLGASKLDQVDVQKLRGALALLETLHKARVLAVRFHVDPVLPAMKKSIEPELIVVDELYSVLYSKESRSRIPNAKVAFTARKPPGGEDFDKSKPLTVMQEIRGYKIFDQPVIVGSTLPGPIRAEFTQLRFAQVIPSGEPDWFKIELRATEESERIVRYDGTAPADVTAAACESV
jgi:hypothetical protein